jgi:hypothetical protein
VAATAGEGGGFPGAGRGLAGSPRIVVALLMLAGLALANRYAPGVLQAILVIVVLYLIVTHGDRVNASITRASAGLAHAFRDSR